VIIAIAKTVAELTSRQDGAIRQQLIEEMTREIVNYDAEFRSWTIASSDIHPGLRSLAGDAESIKHRRPTEDDPSGFDYCPVVWSARLA
jgi:hypothetical protein